MAYRLELLRNLDYVKEGNIESFRAFYNAVIGTSVALKNVKAEAYLMNPELISHLAEKLPAFSKQMWVRHKAFLMKQDIIVDFQEFSRWLEDEMENQLATRKLFCVLARLGSAVKLEYKTCLLFSTKDPLSR